MARLRSPSAADGMIDHHQAARRGMEHYAWTLAQQHGRDHAPQRTGPLAAIDPWMMHARAALTALHEAGLLSDTEAEQWDQQFVALNETAGKGPPIVSNAVREFAEQH